MNQKGIAPLIIVGIVVVVAVAVGIGIYVATRGGGGLGPGNGIASATSLSFNADFTLPTSPTADGSVGALSMFALGTNKLKDIGSVNMKIRCEGTVQGQTVIFIVNGEQRKAWVYRDGQWLDLSENYSWDEIWDVSCGENGLITGYQIALSGWTGGEYTYTDPTGTSIRFYDIELNPTLDDSLFVPSG